MNINLTKEQISTRGGPIDELLNTLVYSAVIIDTTGRILFVNKNSGNYTGYTQEEAVGEFMQNHVFSDDWKQALKGESVIGGVANIAGKKCITNFYPIKENGELIGALGVIPFKSFKEIKNIISNYDSVESGQSNIEYSKLTMTRGNYTFDDFIGKNQEIKKLLHQCKSVAKTKYPVLIIGETGCGKEIIASGIHEEYRGNELTPFIKINCTAIPNELLESELFGHERGAFTGASTLKQGKFEIAENGTILLDEIGDMDLVLQGKLLRVLEEKEFERLGGVKLFPLKARIIASTNRDLWQQCLEGKFRMDLYYRLNLIEIHIPPLRKRREDVYVLVEYLLKECENCITFSNEAYDIMFHYEWPGNVRQLKNMITRLSIMYPGQNIDGKTVGNILNLNNTPTFRYEPKMETMSDVVGEQEKNYILKAMEKCNFNMTATAKELKVGRTTLYNKIRKHELGYLLGK